MKDKVTPVVFGLVALALLAALWAPQTHLDSPRAGEPAPNFRFELEGRPVELADLRGQVVLVNFWATWCPPCVAEMPSLQRLHERLKERGLLVLGVSVDADREAYRSFLQTHNITFPNYRDPERRIPTQYGTFMYPETYIIGRDGRLVRKVIGPLEWDSPDVLDFMERVLAS